MAGESELTVTDKAWNGNWCMTTYQYRGVSIIAQYEIGDECSEVVTTDTGSGEVEHEAERDCSALDVARRWIDNLLDSGEDGDDDEHRLRGWQLV